MEVNKEAKPARRRHWIVSLRRILLLICLPVLAFAQQSWYPQKNKQYIILSEQSKSRVAIVDAGADSIVWEWCPANRPDIKPGHAAWFRNMSDAKPVKNGQFILACASGGGVALIRVADKKTVFYAYAGGNTHSVELLPDGNIVTASSTGNFMRLFVYNDHGYPDDVAYKDFYLHDGHNLVWDKKRKLLYTVSDDLFKTYQYNQQTKTPELTVIDSLTVPEGGAHDLYWDISKRFLWLSSSNVVFTIGIPGKKVDAVEAEVVRNVKSISSGPTGYPTIVIQPKESWWTDEVLDIEGNSIFKQNGLQIYKARWLFNF